MKKFFLGLLSAVMMLVVAVSCSSTGDRTFGNCIPDDAIAVVKMNVKSLFDKSAVADMPEYKEAMEVLEMSIPSEMKDLYDKIMENPAESGIDINHPAVIAVNGPLLAAKAEVILRVADRQKVTNLLETLDTESVLDIVEESGCTHVNTGEKNVDVAYDDYFFILTATDRKTAPAASSYLNLKEEKSLASNENAADFVKAGEDIVVFLNNEKLMAASEMVGGNNGMNISSLMQDTYTMMTLNFEVGQVTSIAKVYPGPQYKKYMDCVKPASDKFLDKVPANSYVVANASIQNLGDALSEAYGSAFDQIDRELKNNIGLTSKGILNSFDGDILVFVAPNREHQIPYFGVYSELKDRTLWETIQEGLASAPAEKVSAKGTDSYLIQVANEIGVNYELRFEENALVFEPEGFACRPTIRNTQYADLFKISGVLINIESILEDPTVVAAIERDSELAALEPMFKQFVALTGETKANFDTFSKLTINTEKNSLAFIVDLAKKFSEASAAARVRYSYDDYYVDDDVDFDWSDFE